MKPLADMPLADMPLADMPLADMPRAERPLDDVPEAPASDAQWRGPTLDVATLHRSEGHRSEGDRSEGDRFVVMLPDGQERLAELAPGLDPELARECLRQGRPMLVRRDADELQLIGALQTERSPVSQHDGVVTLAGREVRVQAERHLELEVGSSRLALQQDGKLALLVERVTMHASSLIKLIASKVELP